MHQFSANTMRMLSAFGDFSRRLMTPPMIVHDRPIQAYQGMAADQFKARRHPTQEFRREMLSPLPRRVSYFQLKFCQPVVPKTASSSVPGPTRTVQEGRQ